MVFHSSLDFFFFYKYISNNYTPFKLNAVLFQCKSLTIKYLCYHVHVSDTTGSSKLITGYYINKKRTL